LEYYEDAKEQYESNLESHKEPDWVSELQPIANEMICYAETMIERCEEFILAEKLEEEGKEEDAETARNLAPKPSEECDFDDEK
jgi:cell division septum initiation protein DivIVA